MPDENEDISNIKSLILLVAELADKGTVDEYITLFSDNAVWKLETSDEKIVGLKAIYDGSVERRKQKVTGPDSNTRHEVTPVTVKIFGDVAQGHSELKFYTEISQGPKLTAQGRYQDKFIRTSKGWKLTYRSIDWEMVESGA